MPSWLPAAFADEIVAASSTAVPAPWGNVHRSTRRHVDTSTRRAMTRCSNWASPRPTGITTGKAGPTSPVRLEGSPIRRPHFSRWLLQKWQQLQLATTGYYWQLLAILVTKIMSLAPDYSSILGYEFYFERPVTKSWDNDLLLHILLDSCSNQCQNDAVKLPSQAWAKRFGTSIQLVVGLGRSQRRMIFVWLRPFLSLKSLQVNCPHPFFCGSFAQTVSRSADICLRQDPENLWLLDFCLGAKNHLRN